MRLRVINSYGLASKNLVRICGKGRVTIQTHRIDGLNEADFIFAAKADALA